VLNFISHCIRTAFVRPGRPTWPVPRRNQCVFDSLGDTTGSPCHRLGEQCKRALFVTMFRVVWGTEKFAYWRT
jgi:hypothetical protein